MSEKAIATWEFVLTTVAALVLGIVLSIGAVYGLNRYFDEHDDAPRVFSYPSGHR